VTGCDVVTSAFISDESRVAIRDHHHRCPPSYELDVDHPFPYLRMSSDASTGRDTRSLQYVLRSGFAGGVAGCVVSFGSSQWLKSRLLMSMSHRPRLSLLLSTESRSYSKLPIRTFRNMQVCHTPFRIMHYSSFVEEQWNWYFKGLGAVHSKLRPRSIESVVRGDFYKATLRPYSAYFRTRPSSSWPMTKFASYVVVCGTTT
jgi:hypothetical protein